MPQIITLTTDLGSKDNYVGIMKGVILSINPNATIVDITHQISPGNIKEAAYNIKTAYRYFPPNTVHIIVVDPGVGTKRKILLLETPTSYFICPDNGILTYILKDFLYYKLFHVTNSHYFLEPLSNTFHGRDIMAPVGAHLSKGIEASCFGPEIQDIITLQEKEPQQTSFNTLKGKIIYCDHFGNLVTNITKDHIPNQKEFEIIVKNEKIDKISSSYLDVEEGNLLAIWGSAGFLEISISCGNAKERLNAKVGDTILIRF
jgi:hypothetical protein